MGIPVFDTFEISQGFEKVGFPKEQVAALTKALASVRSDPEAVSKAELREHKAELKSHAEQHESKMLQAIFELRKDNELLRKDIDAKFEVQRKDSEILKRDIIIRLSTVVMGTTGLALAAAKLLF